jgi:ribose 5-phosphate isomerase B
MVIFLGSDHAGLTLKAALGEQLRGLGHELRDLGVHEARSCDYPDYAVAVGEAVVAHPGSLGLLTCGTGVGMAIAANKVAGVRAAVVSDTFSARMCREHNDANVLCLGERVVGVGLAGEIVAAWLSASFAGGRHAQRVDKLCALDSRPR